MSKIADKILSVARKNAERSDRMGRKHKDFRENPVMDNFIETAEKSGIISALKRPSVSSEEKAHTCGLEAFLDSPQFKAYNESRAGEGRAFEFDLAKAAQYQRSKTASGLEVIKAPSITTVSTIRDNLTTERATSIIPLGVRQMRLTDIYPDIPTRASSYKELRETGFTNNAATRAENVDPASTDSTPVSVFATDFVTVNVETIDHAVPFPKELLDDLPALIAFIRGRMADGLDDKQDALTLSGAGSGSNEFLGLLTDSDVPTYAWSDGVAGDNMADAVLGALVACIAAEYMPDHTILSVLDHASIAKLKGDNGAYLFPFAHRQDMDFALWGVPTYRNSAMATGSGVCGSRRAAQYRTRQAIEYRLTDSHGEHFLDNILYLVAARRVGFLATRPEAFREIDFDNAPPQPAP